MDKIRMARCRKCWNDNIEVVEDIGRTTVYYAVCTNERCGIQTIPFETREEAFNNWNHWNNPTNIKKQKQNS